MTTEARGIWAVARRYWSPYGHFVRHENIVAAGTPDVSYTLKSDGSAGWVELKLFDREGLCPRHFTRDQILWAEEQVAAGGRWFLFGRCGAIWLLYGAPAARALFEGEGSSTPIFRVQGRFPLRESLAAFAGKI